MRRKILGQLFCLGAWLAMGGSLSAQGTAFTYQGQLNDAGAPASGNYDLTFALYGSTNLVSPVLVGPIISSNVPVANGLFTTTLDFGAGIFTGTNYWLDVAVRTNGAAAFTTLMPRQPLKPTPYAIMANAASNLLGVLPSTQLSGAVPSAQISGTYQSAVMFSNSANQFVGTFQGNGSSVSNLNASQLTSGTVADARLSANVALLNANQSFAGVNTFTNFGNSFRGSFFGNGLVGWIPTNGTAVQAVIDTGYVLTSPQLATVTLPATTNIGDIVRISGAGTGGWKIAQNAGQSVFGNFSSYSNANWTKVYSADNWESIACSADGSKWVAVNDANGAYYSGNSGLSWSGSSVPPSSGRGVASSADGQKTVLAVNGGNLFTSTNSGATWQGTGPGNSSWYAVASSADGTKLVAVYSNNFVNTALWTSTNSGVTGSWVYRLNTANLVAVASSADGTKLITAANKNGYLYTSTDSGVNWSQRIGTANWTAVASSADGTRLAAANSSGFIYTSIDSGVNWTQSGAPSGYWTCITSSADGLKLAAAIGGGGIYTSANGGTTWIKLAGASNLNWISIASSADGSQLGAVTHSLNGGIYLSQAALLTKTTAGTNGCITGGPGSAVELQYIGNNQFMPVSSVGTIWAN